MSPKNVIKIIYIQKSYSVHYALFGPLQFYQVLFNPYWSYSVQFNHIQSTLILFVSFCQFWSTSILFGPFSPLSFIRSILSTLVLFGSHWSYSLHYVYFGPTLSIHSYSVPFNPIQCKLVHYVLFSLLSSYSVQFGPPYSHSVLFSPFSPILSIQSNLFIWSICVHFGPIWSILVNFGPFLWTYLQGKCMFRLRALILNLNLLKIIWISNS